MMNPPLFVALVLGITVNTLSFRGREDVAMLPASIGPNPSINAICFLPVKPGMCAAHMPRFYFDARDGTCKSFVYGGCGGNKNNFLSKHASKNPICDLPAERGGCLAVQLSVYFDSNEGKCKPFIYSGCGGNKNNFINNAACMEACGGGGRS
ncbi:hypothetical protein SprV_0501880600 [Sparganum proliferum]